MNEDIISPKTRHKLREYFVSTYCSYIDDEFRNAGISKNENCNINVSGARRYLVEQYYASLDFKKLNDIKKILIVFENVILDLTGTNEKVKNDILFLLKKDGFELIEGRLVRKRSIGNLDYIKQNPELCSSQEIELQIKRIYDSIENDPGLAIGTSKELLETVCKTILSNMNIKYNRNDDFDVIFGIVRKELNLLPENISEKHKGLVIIRKVLGSLYTTSKCMLELRNLYGTGHGREAKHKGIKPRHARLAVNSTIAVIEFLWETYSENFKNNKEES